MMRYHVQKYDPELPYNELEPYMFTIKVSAIYKGRFETYFDELTQFEDDVLSWCREKFGKEDRRGRWNAPRIAMITFRDEKDAVAFRLKFG